MTRLQAISRFSPGNCDPAFLESITVGREDLLRGLEKAVSSSVRSGAGHHSLIVGPRGAGKTHLVALLRDRVQRNEKLRKRVVIAYLKEEERGVAHFLDWLVRILQSFVRHEEAGPELARESEQLMDMEHEAAQAAAEQLLVRFVGKRRLLLLVENLGEIFSSKKGMGREGQQRFRDLVQQHPFWTIVATTQALFDDVQTRDAPFYGFFKIQHVQPLTFEEAASLLERLAEVEQRPKLHAFLKTAPARGRIRAVHSLTRGSPRLLVIFYQFIDSDSVEELSSSFLGMVDSLTSYYQERMNALSAGQQKIVEALCSQRAPVTVKQIARFCFVSQSTASSELKRLADMRYVTSHRAGRESYYEISEPLFRICFEVKENRGYPVRLFVDFLGTFYTADELERKYRSAYLLSRLYKIRDHGKEERRERERLLYIAQAGELHHGIDFVRESEAWDGVAFDVGAFVHDLLTKGDQREVARVADAVVALDGSKEFLHISARAHRELGDLGVARKRVDDLMRVAPNEAETWCERARLEIQRDDLAAAEASYRHALELDATHVDASYDLAWILLQKVELRHDAGDALALLQAWSPGMRYVLLQRITRAMDDVGKAMYVIPEKPESVEEACALLERACVQNPRAWGPLSIGQFLLGKWDACLEAARQACIVEPEVWVFWELRAKGALLRGQYAEAVESLTRFASLKPEDETLFWSHMALAQEGSGDEEAALASLRKATLHEPVDAPVWEHRGRLAVKLGLLDEARRCYEKAAESASPRAGLYIVAAMAYVEHRRYEEGLAVLESIIAGGLEEDQASALCVSLVCTFLLIGPPLERISTLFERHRAAFEAAGRARLFTLGVNQALHRLLQSRATRSLERLAAIAGQIVPVLAPHEDLAVMSRIFAVAVRYLSENDERILLELPLEERNVLQEMLTPPAEPAPSASH
jgi:tetratricopeptide (TPR) repeat protein